MKKVAFLTVLSIALFAIPVNVEIYFSPNGGCQQAVIDATNQAGGKIDVAMYIFTEGDIAKALIAAKDRGVQVRVVLDGGNVNSTYSKAKFLANNDIPVKYETEAGLLHNKFAVIDDSITLTGSFNWTANAETRNHENLLVITSKSLAAKYEAVFAALWLASSALGSASSSSTINQVAPSQDAETVYITSTGAKYHRAGCRYLSRSCIPISKAEAIRRGYTPCSVCNP